MHCSVCMRHELGIVGKGADIEYKRMDAPAGLTRENRTREVAMSESDKSKGLAPAGEARARPKRPYHKPVVRSERVFEVQALTCGKVQTTQGQCHYNRKSS